MNDNNIIVYQNDDGSLHIDVHLEDDTVWLTQQQMADLYQTSKSNVSEHIKHIFEDGELDENSVVRKFRTTAADGKNYNTKCYNLVVRLHYLWYPVPIQLLYFVNTWNGNYICLSREKVKISNAY